MAIYNICDYGAVGDGITVNTAAIQQAIDAAGASGGGRVLIPGGQTFRTGTIILRSGVELHLEMGAVLKASDKLQDFNGLGMMEEIPENLTVPTYSACDYNGDPFLNFIYAKDAVDVAITGRGIIDGNEKIFYGMTHGTHIDGSFYPRSPLLYLKGVEKLTIKDVTLTGSAFWTTHLVGCRDVLIDGIRILNNIRMANCDGIDPDHCQNVRIANCYIIGADDGIVLKNTAANMQYGPCCNIAVTNCNIVSTSAAIKIGSESEALFSEICFSNINIMSPTNRGISIQLRDKGSVENAVFENINIHTQQMERPYWWGDAEPIAVTAVPRNEETVIGHVRNVQFRNINATGENGIFLHGTDKNISDVTFDNVHVTLTKVSDNPWTGYDVRPCMGEGFLDEKHHGIFAKNTGKVTLRDCTFAVDESAVPMAGEAVKSVNAELNIVD